MPQPETSEIQAFVATVDAGSLSGGARLLAVPRATLSRRLARLEEVLGLKLLDRTAREVRPTEAGAVFYEHGQRVLDVVERATDEMRQLDASLRGVLRLATMPLDWGPLREMLYDFSSRHPELEVELHTSTAHIDLAEARIDVALRAGPSLPADLIARTLGHVDMFPMASPAYLADRGMPRTTRELAEHSCIGGFSLGRHPVRGWPLREGGRTRVDPRWRTNDVAIQRDLAERGHGIALLPDLVAEEALRAGRLVPVLADEVGSAATFAAVYRDRRWRKPVVRAFVDHCVQWVQTRTDWLDPEADRRRPAA